MDANALNILINYSMTARKSEKRDFVTYMIQLTMIENPNDLLRPEDKEDLERYIKRERYADVKWAMMVLKDYLFPKE